MSSQTHAQQPGALATWVLAIRPKTLTAAVGPVALGTALAAAAGALRPLAAIAALLGALLIQIGTNLANDWFDFVKGADTADRLGPARAAQRGWLSVAELRAATFVAFGLAALCGVYLIAVAGWPVVAIGVASVASGIAYTGGPKPLAYVGLGDVFVLVFFGPVAVLGTLYVQALGFDAGAVLASLPVGLLCTAILVVNNLRDRHTDAAAGKRTLAVRFGARVARLEYLALVALAYAIPPVAVLLGYGGLGWLLPLASLPLAVVEVRALWTTDGAALNPLLGRTARLGLVHSLLFTVGVLL